VNIALRTGAVASAAALTLLLSACSPSNEKTATTSAAPAVTTSAAPAVAPLSGSIAGAGSSAQASAMEAWIAGATATNPDLTIAYDPVGSGGGRTQFLAGATQWAGSDSALSADEYTTAQTTCGADGAINLPVYISPIAVIFNVDGVTSLNLDAATISAIFDGKITKWNDAAIASQNAGAKLPDLAITTVHRSDDSGTTKNFTDYLNKASAGAWTYPAAGVWPNTLGEAGEGTTGLVQIVTSTKGAIGYADDSKAGTLGKVSIKVGDAYTAPSAAGAATALSTATVSGTNGANDLAYKIDRTTTAAGAYPLLLLSYAIVCQHYTDATVAANVTGFLSYVASAEGQAAAASAAGSAPLPADLSAKVETILATIAKS